MKPRSLSTYSWNQIDCGLCEATSSIEHTDTVDRQKGMFLLAAALAACTSPRRAYMPVRPTGLRITGIASSVPNSWVVRLRSSTLRRMRWRRLISARSELLARSVCSA
ncbi:hypothetical protein PFLmoz3_05227 [Pseudomonas fluorescens]|uniref:Uncharacterized protein n=1 Tax=Pseudomonas fluorescens TaxID=294 RepID=A0A109LCS5_PSEFL|nr:hypothetical protein PFLmoz3_05227 [Pseudomonas fluorescens]